MVRTDRTQGLRTDSKDIEYFSTARKAGPRRNIAK